MLDWRRYETKIYITRAHFHQLDGMIWDRFDCGLHLRKVTMYERMRL